MLDECHQVRVLQLSDSPVETCGKNRHGLVASGKQYECMIIIKQMTYVPVRPNARSSMSSSSSHGSGKLLNWSTSCQMRQELVAEADNLLEFQLTQRCVLGGSLPSQ